ncbi:TolB family protein [Mycolicibacterium sp. jd]|jgi:dipeptidyl aminopeptidase/acylaminoacyl peptidase|uniref:hypothetical protein n=1 Tax=Mycolicibacterium TaxID=1866885 RepID=UPI00298C5B0E|nr:hypothetical protein [Mycolicibacterium sp. D5.8-2]MDW5610655.1 hypothetical protein [Mycolicibacterium sp. D5.8-2]
MKVRRGVATAWISAQVVALAVAACTSAPAPSPDTTAPSTSDVTTAPMLAPPALFYSKAGSLYISDPAGTPGRKLTDGPADTEPAPSPDLAHVAFVREANASDYGGELWVLDLSPEREPDGPPRRLADPAALPSIFGDPEVGDEPSRIVSPRWSPTGDQVAFLQAGEGGGFLFVADAVSGEIVSPEQRLFADAGYAWAPDGQHIAWTGGRSDVSPVDVNVLAVGGDSTSVVKDTNAFSVSYGDAGRTVLFANGDASGELFADIPFALRGGGVYSVATPGGVPIDPPAAPTSLFAGQAMFGDVAVLDSGAVAFTETAADGSSKTIQVLDARSSVPRTTIADVAADSPGPVWGRGDVVAYVDAAPSRPLIVTDSENRTPEPIDTGVDAFAWPPPPR